MLELLDSVALLETTEGTLPDGKPVLLTRGIIGVVVEVLEPPIVLVEFADQEGVTQACAFVDQKKLLRLRHLDEPAVADQVAEAWHTLERAPDRIAHDADETVIARLQADQDYALVLFEECWRALKTKDPAGQGLLRVLRAAKPDLSAAIPPDLDGEGFARGQLARMIMDPMRAKQASLQRLVVKVGSAARAGTLKPCSETAKPLTLQLRVPSAPDETEVQRARTDPQQAMQLFDRYCTLAALDGTEYQAHGAERQRLIDILKAAQPDLAAANTTTDEAHPEFFRSVLARSIMGSGECR